MAVFAVGTTRVMTQELPASLTPVPSGYAAWLAEEAQEREVEAALVKHVTEFLLEPGAGFAFVGRQALLDVTLMAGNYVGWRTQAEQDANPQSGVVQMGIGNHRSPVIVTRPRAALKFDALALSEDLMVPLRRQWKT